jgi:hypothetical protein
MSDCLLCLLASRQAEVSVVHEDERTVTFMDIQPVVRGHMLIVPRRHPAYLADLDVEDGAQLFRVGSSPQLRCGLPSFAAKGSTSSLQTVRRPGKKSSTCISMSSRATRAAVLAELLGETAYRTGSGGQSSGTSLASNRALETHPAPLPVLLVLKVNAAELNWFSANLRVAAALAERGYDLRLVLGDGGHNPNHGGAILPDALRWLWRRESE